jgi:hypothetical protein
MGDTGLEPVTVPPVSLLAMAVDLASRHVPKCPWQQERAANTLTLAEALTTDTEAPELVLAR